MAYRKPYPRCIYCGAKADSREHAIPKWMSKRLGIKEQLPGTAHKLTPQRHPISFGSHRARIVCKTCNTHFGHLEEASIPLAMPMATGRVLSLSEESRTILALWASKTAIMLIAANEDLRELVPQAHRDSIRYADRPPSESWVGYFPWSGTTTFFTGSNSVTLGGVDPPLRVQGQVYSVVFTFKRLGFKVAGFIEPPPSRYRIGGSSNQIRQFWPRLPGLIHWPPISAPLSQEDMGSLIYFAPLIQR